MILITLLISSFFIGGISTAYWKQMKLAKYLFNKYDVIYHTSKDMVTITVDDVPYTKESFKQIIHGFDNQEVKATFFVISSLATEETIEILIETVKNGHHLANHGKTDSRHASLSKENLIDEIMSCERFIESIYQKAGVEKPEIKYYRPGCGFVNSVISSVCDELNFKIVLGSNYPSDPQVIFGTINNWYVRQHLKPNDIIILHDRSWTANSIENLIKEIKKYHKIGNLVSSL